MKKIVAIGLLVLLLYNTFGLALAVLFFENDFKVASPISQDDNWRMVKLYLPSLPYSDSWENSEGIEGLLQRDGNFYNTTHILHQNDTLYVTLKSNLAAREQFYELANMMETITDTGKNVPESIKNKLLKVLEDLVKNYVPISKQIDFLYLPDESSMTNVRWVLTKTIYSYFNITLNTPPPEIA